MSGILQTAPYPPGRPGGAPGFLVFAGFWWRFLAWAIDVVILTGINSTIVGAAGLRHVGLFGGNSPDHLDDGGALSTVAYHVQLTGPSWTLHGGSAELVSLLVTVAYFALLESSAWQGTVGKRVCRLRVTDLAGRRIRLPRALGRYLGKYVSAALLMLGFLMAGWTMRKQALHDIIASTLVARLRFSDPVFTVRQPAG